MIRLLKIVLVTFVGLQGLFYAIQNIVNLNACYGAVSAVLTMANHTVYPAHFGPPVTAHALIWAAVWIIIAGELLVGILSLIGAFRLFTVIGAAADIFNAAKTFAILGCGMAIVVWFGFFMAFGGAYFQMWQTAVGQGSLSDAFKFAAISGVVMIFVNMADA